jgi:hypothetical protein
MLYSTLIAAATGSHSERRDSTPASYSRDLRFKHWHGDWLSRISLFFLQSPHTITPRPLSIHYSLIITLFFPYNLQQLKNEKFSITTPRRDMRLVKVQLHIFLTSTGGRERSASRPSRFTLRERAPALLSQGRSEHYRESNPDSLGI